jgi:hypothetical protein
MLVLVEDSPRRWRPRMFSWAIWTGPVIGGGSEIQWPGSCDALVRPMLVVEAFELAQSVEQVTLVPERRKLAQVPAAHSGAGSTPASLRISHTVEAATSTPRTRSSP